MAVVVVAAIAVLSGGDEQPGTPLADGYGVQNVLPIDGLKQPLAVTVDDAGNVYVSDHNPDTTVMADVDRLLKVSPGTSDPTILPFAGEGPSYTGVAVDDGGTVYVVYHHDGRVLRPASGGTPEIMEFNGLDFPYGVAVDDAGAVYVTSVSNGQVAMLPPGGSQEVLPFVDLDHPAGVAVDGTGFVYVADEEQVLKLAPGAASQEVLPFVGLSSASDLAVDTDGAVYVVDHNQVLKLAAGATNPEMLPFSGLSSPRGVAVDRAGNVYVADQGNRRVLVLPRQ